MTFMFCQGHSRIRTVKPKVIFARRFFTQLKGEASQLGRVAKVFGLKADGSAAVGVNSASVQFSV